ncbi:hypothetical protein [Halostella sp. PRR32]|uniref:hypothetical protein n=1 Tax=Halostella sp. PRR32 TaxID=3098147 RepID=UPI002B1D24AB|nr:hypothetical protein [Halostella sp. PRR32]
MASDSRAPNKRVGERIETAIARRVPALGLVPDDVAEHYDAVATTTIDAQTLPMAGACLVERGTSVEIKSAARSYADGQRGRFYVRAKQHAELLTMGGVYLFAVRDRDDESAIHALKAIPASLVDELLPSWLDGGPGRAEYAQVSWGRLFEAAEVGCDE